MLFCLALISCKKTNVTAVNTVTTAIDSPVLNLDPVFATSANTQRINQLIHISLLKMGEDLRPAPFLAKNFKLLSNTEIEFTLKKGCKFHNGQEITAEDVKKTFLLYRDKKIKSPYQSIMQKLIEIKIINPYKIRIKTEKSEPSLLTDIIVIKILPVDEYSKEKFENEPIGGGAFRVKSHNSSETILLASNSNCIEKPKINSIKIKVIRDQLSKYLKLRNGTIDILLNNLDYRKVRYAQKHDTGVLSVKHATGVTYSYIGLNFRDKKLSDWRIRKALQLSLNIPEIIKYKKHGLARPASGMLANMNWYSHLGLSPATRNIKKAKQLLDDAGYYNGTNNKPKLVLRLKTTTYRPAIENAQVMVAQAKEAGIEIKHRAFEWGTFYADVKAKNTQLYNLRWVGVTDPGHFYNIFHSKGRLNRTFYHNKKLDELIDKAQNTLNPDIRKKYFLKVQELVEKDLPYISLWFDDNVAIYRNSISNVKLFPNGSWFTFLLLEKREE